MDVFFYFHLSKVGGKLIFLGNLAPKDARKVDIKDDFIQELIELWADFNYRDSFASKANFSAGYIWNNSMIRIAGRTIFYRHWANAGVMKINDLKTSDSRIISYSCFCFPVSFLEFCRVTSAIRSAMRSLELSLPGEKILENVLIKLNSLNKPSQAAYKILITKRCIRPEKSQNKWIKDCGLVDVENLDRESIYLLPRICTLSTKLRNFQFKFLHRRISTNSFLFKIKLSEQIFVAFVNEHKVRCFIFSSFRLCRFDTSLTSFNSMSMFRPQRREKRLVIQSLFTTWQILHLLLYKNSIEIFDHPQ